MSNITSPLPASIEHPMWCSPEYCERDNGGTWHTSATDHLVFPGAGSDFTLTLRRVDSPDDGSRAPSYITLGIESGGDLECATPLSPADARQLAIRLIEFAAIATRMSI